MVPEVGLEPTKPKGGRFTVSCDCHYTIPAQPCTSPMQNYVLYRKEKRRRSFDDEQKVTSLFVVRLYVSFDVEPLPGFEPGTYCLQNSCSNQLS